MSAVDNYFIQKGEPYTLEDGMVCLGEDNWEFGLSNLVQMCARIKPKDFSKLIEHHFGLMIESKAFKEKLVVDDFEKMKQYIGVRLYDKEYVTIADEDITIRRPFAGEVFAVLVYDFPQAIENIPRSDMDKWSRTEDELFTIGIENISQNYQLKAQEVTFGEDTVFALETKHFFAPNILLEIDKHKELIGKGGAIIGIPTRSLAMIYPIHDMKVVGALTLFFNSIPKIYAESPGSLTREIYWYNDGQYEVLNYEPGKKVKFTPSDEFLVLLNGGLE